MCKECNSLTFGHNPKQVDMPLKSVTQTNNDTAQYYHDNVVHFETSLYLY